MQCKLNLLAHLKSCQILMHNIYSWTDVEMGKKVNIKNETEVFGSAKKLYEASLRYLDKMREIAAEQVQKLRWVYIGI